MERRKALQRMALILGGVVTAPSLAAILNSCKSPSDSTVSSFAFDTDLRSLVAEVAEVIIPKTDTPGAKETNVQDVIEILLKDCYSEDQQKHFLAGLNALSEEAKSIGGDFAGLDADKKLEIVEIMRQKAQEEHKKNAEERKAQEIDNESGVKKEDHLKKNPPIPFFTLMRDLTIFGYFSSEYAIKNEYNFSPVPGKWDSCIQVGPEEKAMS